MAMKQWHIFAAVFFFAGGVFSAHAQDIIILKDGNMIEARVTEISPSEIRYKRYSHLDGPTVVIPSASVLSIRYENGKVERLGDAVPSTRPQSARVPAAGSESSALDPQDLNFGISLNPAGFIPRTGGLSLSFDFTKGKFNSKIDIRSGLGLHSTFYGKEYFGISPSFNYFHHSRIGGFYIGGILEYSVGEIFMDDSGHYIEDGEITHRFGLALNAGYTFVTQSGAYFRAGFAGGYSFGAGNGLIIRPDISVGYNFNKK